MTTPDQVIANIREALDAIGPASWTAYHDNEAPELREYYIGPSDNAFSDYGIAFELQESVARFIAACNPQNIAVILAALQSAAETPAPSSHMAGEALEMAARLIEENIIMDTSAGKVLAPRQDGNRDGLHYAAAIRALAATATEGLADA